MNELSPMMQQYIEIKKKHKDEIVFFRLGDFYEMFYDDAVLVSRELDLTLTGRNCGGKERAPMCGIPYHSCESYISRLIEKGYKIVICEQQEESNGRTLFRREVTRVITPGTVLDGSILDESKNNFLCSLFLLKMSAGICFCDISTGELKISYFSCSNLNEKLENEIKMYSPKEILLSGEIDPGFSEKLSKICSVSIRDSEKDFKLKKEKVTNFLKQKLNLDITNVECYGNNQREFTFSRCCSVLFCYLEEIQKKDFDFIKSAEIYNGSNFMSLKCDAISNLELFETIRTKQKKGSLLWVLEKTRTAMGKRLLRSWIERPLMNVKEINFRLNGVEELISDVVLMDDLFDILGKIGDVQRLLSKISFGSANCRDLKSLGSAISMFSLVKSSVSNMKSEILMKIFNDIDELSDVFHLIDSSIVDDPPLLTRDGGFIKKGFDKNLDIVLKDMNAGESLASKIEREEREKTGIPKLKVGFNKVFGYFIEVSQSYKNMVPDSYIRRQTLSGRERYITEELKLIEARIFSAKDRSIKMENEILQKIKSDVSLQSDRISKTANAIANLDVILSFARVSSESGYVKPILNDSYVLELKNSRHPVVEKLLPIGISFVSNDVFLDKSNTTMVITGPNMAGKSTYMRQIALNVIMAQIGCFVAADYANIGVIDSIFTRIGASDDVSSGQSTFMVEMNEVAQISKNAGDKSLVLLDEIGRGTSTFDGLSIAQAVLEFMSQTVKSKTLFSTHYHEISKVSLKSVQNFNVLVSKDGDDIVFLRKIVPGSSDDSYGIEVAKLAGVPDEIIFRAKEILKSLENNKISEKLDIKSKKQDERQTIGDKIFQTLKKIDINALTPIESMNILSSILKSVKS